VYVSAFLLPDGKSIFDYSQSTPGFASLLLPQYLVVEPDKGISSIKPDGLREVFLADASDEDYAWASAHTQIDYLAPSGTQVSLDGGFGRVPRFYVETSQDRAVPLEAQRRGRSRRPSCRPRRDSRPSPTDASHAHAQSSHPRSRPRRSRNE
jgi:hypothetical protein